MFVNLLHNLTCITPLLFADSGPTINRTWDVSATIYQTGDYQRLLAHMETLAAYVGTKSTGNVFFSLSGCAQGRQLRIVGERICVQHNSRCVFPPSRRCPQTEMELFSFASLSRRQCILWSSRRCATRAELGGGGGGGGGGSGAAVIKRDWVVWENKNDDYTLYYTQWRGRHHKIPQFTIPIRCSSSNEA